MNPAFALFIVTILSVWIAWGIFILLKASESSFWAWSVVNCTVVLPAIAYLVYKMMGFSPLFHCLVAYLCVYGPYKTLLCMA